MALVLRSKTGARLRYNGLMSIAQHLMRLKPFAAAAVVALALVALHYTSLGDALDVHVSQRFLFNVRGRLGLGPGLDPRIKIFAYDDGTVASLKALDLELGDWAKVFATLDRQKPNGIFLDKLFDKPFEGSEAEAFSKEVEELGTPITVAAFVTPHAIQGRAPLSLERPRYRTDEIGRGTPDALDFLPIQGGVFYGAASGVSAAFEGIGHAVYWGDGRVVALYRLNEAQAVPHWAFFGANELHAESDELYADGRRVPLDAAGRVLVNIDRPEVYAKRAFAMLPVVTRARKGDVVPIVNAGDYVVILPAMYTGNTDFKETPHGSVPGGYIMAAMLSSVLTGKWIDIAPHVPVWILLLSLLGGVIAARLSPTRFWLALAGGAVLIVGAGVVGFALLSFYIPWLPCTLGFGSAALLVFADRQRGFQLERVRMEKELETARLVQDSFFPAGAQGDEALAVEGFFHPASECGGDWWGHFSPAPGIEYVMIGDATGHGVSAALVTAMAFSTCQAWAHALREAGGTEHAPGKLLRRLNQVLCDTRTGNATMTFFVAVIDRSRHVITFSNAGHNFPYLIKAPDEFDQEMQTSIDATDTVANRRPLKPGESRVRKLSSSPGPILGLEKGGEYPEACIAFKPGDKVFFFTDGLIENANGRGEVWGYSLQKRLKRSGKLDAKALRDTIEKETRAFVGDTPPRDDTTVVVIEARL